MGDISRHRDIFLNTRDAIPPSLLDKCNIAPDDLTYLEMGNYLTDVSQFRDPVTYIFAKRRIWREKIMPQVPEDRRVQLLQGLMAMSALAASAWLQAEGKKILGALPLAVLPLQGLTSNLLNDALADLGGLDGWIDRMFGKPIERIKTKNNKRDDKDYGYVGQFFQFFIEGITHFLFASGITHEVTGEWGNIDRIPEASVTKVFQDFFTQYYPHEHTDQPPYVWDASQRHKEPKWYAPSKRQRDLVNTDVGIMNVVDKDYVQYLAEELSKLEAEWRKFKPNDSDARRNWLVRMGKVLHGIEDWYFHSNVVELIRLRAHKPPPGQGESSEEFLRRFVESEISKEAAFIAANQGDSVEFKRRLYRTLRFPVYERGDKSNSAGKASKVKSTLSLHHAYPAFPSQQDTAHTLLGAMGNLEEKAHAAGGETPTEPPPWLPCVLLKFYLEGGDVRKVIDERCAARRVDPKEFYASLAPGAASSPAVKAVRVDVLRELLPLVLTIMHASERQRLNANIDPIRWPVVRSGPPGTTEIDDQLKRHVLALKPKTIKAGVSENNYQRAARYLHECGYINVPGRDALIKAFEIDAQSEKLHGKAPGSGGFLIQFALELQEAVDRGEAEAETLNKDKLSPFKEASDNGSFNEIIGSHSLMSKDTLESSPFFNDAKVLASVASQSVFQIMLEEVSAPAGSEGIHWQKILHHFIRFPVVSTGWERSAMTFFRNNGARIPRYADLPELAQLKSARLSTANLQSWLKGTKAAELEGEYIKLEGKVSHYRY